MKKISDFIKEELYATPMNTTGMANPAMPADTTVPTNISDNVGSGDIPSFFRSKRKTKRKKKRNRINEKLVITHYKPYSCAPQSKEELREIINKRLVDDPNTDLNDIDVSKITDMSYLFKGLDPHNIDISDWDVSNVENMIGMFYDCENFNSNLSKWNVSKVKNMSHMFDDCTKFNSDLSDWNVSNVIDMQSMFYNCIQFNSDLNRWDISNLRNMYRMFDDCDSMKELPDWY